MDFPLVAAFRHVPVEDGVRCCIQNSDPGFMFPALFCAPPSSHHSDRCSFASACRRCSPRVLFVQTIGVDVPIKVTAAVRASCPGVGGRRTEGPRTSPRCAAVGQAHDT